LLFLFLKRVVCPDVIGCWQLRDFWEMTNEMKFERSDYYKQKGNEFYKVNAY